MTNLPTKQLVEENHLFPTVFPRKALKYLTPVEQYIVSSRNTTRKKRKTYKEMAAHFYVGTRTIKKVEAQAMRKLAKIYENILTT